MKYERFRHDTCTVSLKMQCLSPELNSAQNGQSGSSNTSRTFANSSAVSGPVFEKYIIFPNLWSVDHFGPQKCCCWSQGISTVLSFSTAEHMPFFLSFYFHLCFFFLLKWTFIKTFHCPNITHVHTLKMCHWKCLHKLGGQINTFFFKFRERS